MRALFNLVAAGLLLAGLAQDGAAQNGAARVRAGGSGVAGFPAGLVAFETQEVRGLPAEARPFVLSLRLDGALVDLRLRPRPIRSDGFRVLVPRGGRLVPVPPPPPRTLAGVVDSFPESRVTGSLATGGVQLVVELGDGRSYGIQPETVLVPGASPSARHLSFRLEDVVGGDLTTCGTDGSMRPGPWVPSVSEGGSLGGSQASVTGIEIFELAVDADQEFYMANGSSIPDTVADVETVLNLVRIHYEDELQLSLEVTTIVVRDSGDPYTSFDSGDRLDQFRRQWNRHPDLGANVRRDLAHLFTDAKMNALGRAYVAEVCGSLTSGHGYGMSLSSFSPILSKRQCLTSHEIGHNFGANHCDGDGDCGIMCSTLNGCPGGCSQFGSASTGVITSYKNSLGCLTTQQDSIAQGMLEEFPSGTLSTLNWSYNDGGAVNGNGSNEPTSPNALDLNAAGSGPYVDDDVRTNYIQLGSASEASVSYFVQHVGVESGEELVVDYRIEDNENWSELDRVTSDGVDETSFVYREIAVPANGLHDEFRLRFRTEVDETNDHWYVDNVAAGTFRDVAVESTPSGEAVTVTPSDNQANGDGTTPFARVYVEGAAVTLTAPSTSGSLEFFDWELDSVPQGSDESLELVVGGDVTATAVYKSVFAPDRLEHGSPGGADRGVAC